MAGALIGALRVSLSMDTAAFEKGATLAQKQSAALGKRMQALGTKVQGIGAAMSVGITAPFTALISAAIPAAIESQKAIGQVNAALASMGPVAGRTAGQLQEMAGKLQSISLFDDDDILAKVTANMLTFGNVSGEAFDRAQLAAVNLSARLGQDLQSSAIQVGKALNDPIKGITALARVGVSFTETQKEQIKAMVEAGNVAGAQGIILGELERQYGGAAKAARDASPGADLQEKWRTFQEVIGALALKVLPPLTNLLTGVLNAFNNMSPTLQAVVVGGTALLAVLGPIAVGFGGLLTIIGSVAPAVTALSAAFGVLKAGFIAARIAAIATLPALTPFLIPLGAIAAAAVAVYVAWRNWDKITAIVQRLYQGVKTWLMDKLGGVLNWVGDKIKWVADKFKWLDDVVVRHSYVPDMVEDVGKWFAKLDPLMAGVTDKVTKKTAAAFQGMQQKVKGILAELFPEVQQLQELSDKMATLRDAEAKGIISPEIGLEARRRLGGIPDQNPIAQDVPNADITSGVDYDALAKIGPQLPDLISQTQEWNNQLQLVASRGLNSIADGLTDVLMGTAKLGDVFRSVISGMLADLIRFQIRKLMVMGLDAAFGAGTGASLGLAGARAMGGPVMGGKAYLVGERGPEIFTPGSSGGITPNNKLGGTTIHAPITIMGNATRETAGQIGSAMRRTIADANRKGF